MPGAIPSFHGVAELYRRLRVYPRVELRQVVPSGNLRIRNLARAPWELPRTSSVRLATDHSVTGHTPIAAARSSGILPSLTMLANSVAGCGCIRVLSLRLVVSDTGDPQIGATRRSGVQGRNTSRGSPRQYGETNGVRIQRSRPLILPSTKADHLQKRRRRDRGAAWR